MAVEERLVDRHVLDRNNAFVPVNFENPIDQEKRIPVRQNPHDFSYAQFHALKEATNKQKSTGFFVAFVLLRPYFLGGSAGFGAAEPGVKGVLTNSESTRRIISVVISATS